MQTLTDEEFKKKYGVIAASQFDEPKGNVGLFDSIKNDLSNRQNNMVSSQSPDYQGVGGAARGVLHNAAQAGGGVSDVVGETLQRTPVVGGLIKKTGEAIGKGFNAITDTLGGTKFFGEAAAGLEPNSPLEKGLNVAKDAGEVAGTALMVDQGVGAARSGASAIAKAVGNIPKPELPQLGGATNYVKGAVRDVTPTIQNRIDSNVAKALDLTPRDLTNIEKSTGNGVGRWMADNNLIGTNKATTQALIAGFFKTNYDAVRAAIEKVPTVYKMNQIPRFFDALKQIQKTVEGVPGLENVSVEVDNLLNKADLTLADVQRVKELMDEHFSLYKVTGDVAGGAAKEGLSNMRSDLRSFIESEVKKHTGEDIRAMNNNVSTARSITDAIETRISRGITRNHFQQRDLMMGLGLSYFGSPIIGAAYVFLKKLAETPTARLRWARFLDKQSDAYKARVSEQLNKGEVPLEAEKVINSQ